MLLFGQATACNKVHTKPLTIVTNTNNIGVYVKVVFHSWLIIIYFLTLLAANTTKQKKMYYLYIFHVCVM